MSRGLKEKGSIAAFIGGVLLLFWWLWRGFLIAGGPYPAGPPCRNQIMCQEGLCLSHARSERSGPLLPVAGYCSQHCESDAGCPADMACEPLPAGISPAAGDHLPLIKLPKKLCIRYRSK
jgi:hypothetical protein